MNITEQNVNSINANTNVNTNINVTIVKNSDDAEVCPGNGNGNAPSIKRIVEFAIPAIGVYLFSPLLSMIDTGTVGLFCGTLQQAALNPAVTITDYSARAMSFLYTGTTNMIATETSSSKHSSNHINDVKDTFLGALRYAFLTGTSLALLLLSTSHLILPPLIGRRHTSTVDPQLLLAAWRYTAVRALGMPAAAIIGTSQAACLGMGDHRTPVMIIAASALINLLLDVALVTRVGWVWVGGTAGAAWATTLSQWFAVCLFWRRFARGPTDVDVDVGGGSDARTRTTKGFLAGRLQARTFLRVPCQSARDLFRPYIVPITTTQVGRCSTYVAMGHVVSSTLDTASMAAQQIVTSIFYALIPIGDSCSLAAQTFLPALLPPTTESRRGVLLGGSPSPADKTAPPHRSAALHRTLRNIYTVAISLGALLSLIAASLPLLSPLFTADPAVIATVRQIVPIMLVILSTHGVFCASEGVLLGMADLGFLGRIYAVFFVVVPLCMLRIKRVAAEGGVGVVVGLRSVWDVFLGYQGVRIVAFGTRVLVLRRRYLRGWKEEEETRGVVKLNRGGA